MTGALVATLGLCLVLGGQARAELVWEPVGPVPSSVGMTALVSDPTDPRVLWMASGSSVWVSDDAGESFSLVLQMSRAAAITREVGGGESLEAVPDTPDASDEPEDPEDLDQIDDSSDIDPATGLPIPDDAEAVTIGSADADEAAASGLDEGSLAVSGDAIGLFGVSRLRLLGDRVFVCTGRGLWVVDRGARGVGTGSELRFGRRLAVNDVGLDSSGALFVGTDRGLYAIGSGGVGRRVSGFEDGSAVTALALLRGHLVAASSGGVRVQSDLGFQRLGVFSARESVSDLIALTANRLGVVSANQVAIVAVEEGTIPYITERWTVPGVRRISAGRFGSLWAVGARGVWRFTEDEGWKPHNPGLMDRRLADLAPASDGPAHLYVAGRAGTARLVPEAARLWTARAKYRARFALDGLPTAEETLTWAISARSVSLDQADDWGFEESLAWLLPHVKVSWRANRRRDEDALYIPTLDLRILDSVQVWPQEDELRIEARWNLMPAFYVALNGTSPQIRAARTRARRAQARVRDTVAPLYQTWASKRVNLMATEFHDARQVVRELLAMQQLEADLYVYTGGKFPILDTTKWAPPSDASVPRSPRSAP